MAFLVEEGLIKGEELPAGELPRKIVEASEGFCLLLFTAQPEAPAFVLAGASGWAVNDWINDLGTTLVINMAAVVSVVRYSAEPQFSFDAF